MCIRDRYIYEHAGEDSLSFRGHFAEGCLTGTILEHNVHIYYKPDDLYVRYNDESDWEKTDEVELAELKAFLTTPHEIIALVNDQLGNVLMGPEKGRDDNIYKTVYWIIETPEMWETLFPALDPTIIEEGTLSMETVSYTHLDVYKRQPLLIETGLPPGTLLNINVPPGTCEKIKGVCVTRLGDRRYRNTFQKRTDPRGKHYYWLAGDVIETQNEKEFDVGATKEGYISVTPIHFDLTRYDLFETLQKTIDRIDLFVKNDCTDI